MDTSGRVGGFRAAVRRVPVPLAGLMLGLASAGSMVGAYSPGLKTFFGVLALVPLALLALRVALDSAGFVEEMRNPAIVGIFCTVPVGVSILTTYISPALPGIAYAVWMGMSALHAALIVYFTRAFMLRLDVRKILPAYFITYVGVGVGAIVAPAYGAYGLGQAMFWFGFATYLALLPPIAYRVIVVRSMPEPLLPNMAIFAAPASICLVGYLRSFGAVEPWLVSLMFAMCVVSYAAVVLYLPRLVRMKFYPTCAALTFPLAITAIATEDYFAYLRAGGTDLQVLQYLAWGEVVLALVVIAFVLARYVDFYLIKPVGAGKV